MLHQKRLLPLAKEQEDLDPIFQIDYCKEEDIDKFAERLNQDPDNEVIERLVSLTDFFPVDGKVQRLRLGKKKSLDQTREGFIYQIIRWPILAIILTVIYIEFIFYVIVRQIVNLWEWAVTWRGRRAKLRDALRSAKSYKEWIEVAETLDTYLGYDDWKQDPNGSYYDARLVRKVNKNLRTMMESQDPEGLKNVLEACVKGNFAGIENFRIYSATYYGTKENIEEHVQLVEQALDFVRMSADLSLEDKRQLFKYAYKNYGRTALSLSGGACFGYYHFGVIRALIDADLLPKIVSGTSAGGVVAALVCCYTIDELKRILVTDLHKVITPCDEGPRIWIPRYFRTGARFDTVRWAHKVQFFTRGSMTFREAYERTGRILNISVIPYDPHSPPKLLNYLTAPDCVIWTAVIASAAVPGIINPVVLMMKTKTGELVPYNFGHKWKDGSLRTDIPVQSLNTHFNVHYTIVSQVNPHIHLFFYSPRGSVGRPVPHRRGKGWRGGFLSSALEQYLKLDILKNMRVARDLELLPRFMGQDWSWVWLQRFEGNVTIWPKTIFMDWIYILSDPTRERMERFLRIGQYVTWPRLHMIENRLRIERAVMRGRDDVKREMLGSIRAGENAWGSVVFSGSDTDRVMKNGGSGSSRLETVIDADVRRGSGRGRNGTSKTNTKKRKNKAIKGIMENEGDDDSLRESEDDDSLRESEDDDVTFIEEGHRPLVL